MQKETVKRVAVCGGSGSSLLEHALAAGADAFVTADITYHRFFDTESKMMLCDIGHFESEQFTLMLIHEMLVRNFPIFAFAFSKTVTNPVHYYT
jgi:putative NIF3 family GTP cyclohydrolase 1 type 2